jgi:hypothetical protein
MRRHVRVLPHAIRVRSPITGVRVPTPAASVPSLPVSIPTTTVSIAAAKSVPTCSSVRCSSSGSGSIGTWGVGVVVVVEEGRCRHSRSFGSGLLDFAVESLGTAPAEGVGDEGDKQPNYDEPDDGEYTRDCTGVLEESERELGQREVGEGRRRRVTFWKIRERLN